MFPCVGQIVVAQTDDQAHEKSRMCRVCGKTLTEFDHHSVQKVALCCICHDRLMESMPHLAQ